MIDDDAIEVVELYRGVGIEDGQPAERIEAVVKPGIDRVHAMHDPDALVAYAGNARNPPEARLFAAAKCEAARGAAPAAVDRNGAVARLDRGARIQRMARSMANHWRWRSVSGSRHVPWLCFVNQPHTRH